jgi:hypothetical protein
MGDSHRVSEPHRAGAEMEIVIMPGDCKGRNEQSVMNGKTRYFLRSRASTALSNEIVLPEGASQRANVMAIEIRSRASRTLHFGSVAIPQNPPMAGKM